MFVGNYKRDYIGTSVALQTRHILKNTSYFGIMCGSGGLLKNYN